MHILFITRNKCCSTVKFMIYLYIYKFITKTILYNNRQTKRGRLAQCKNLTTQNLAYKLLARMPRSTRITKHSSRKITMAKNHY